MKIVEKSVSKLKTYENNPRKNDNGVEYVANSIRDFGFNVPIVIDKNDIVVCGHTRLKAARKLKLDKVPCLVADDLTEEQIKAFRLVDNQVSGIATWDNEILENELAEIKLAMKDYGFDLGQTLKNSSEEINVADFDDEKFNYECPCCGFKFNKG